MQEQPAHTPLSRLVKPLAEAEPEPGAVFNRPPSRWPSLDLVELWRYRELLFFLTWRDIKVRYKQTALGAAWAVIQPFMSMVVFSIFFGRLAGLPSEGIPYPIFTYSALVPWTFFANALSQASNSLVQHEKVITKVYFPRLLVPLSAVLSMLADFGVSFLVLLVLMLYYGVVPGAAILALPFLVFLTTLTALSVGLWLAAINVKYRDVRYITPFLVQFWLFATPIVYSSSLVPENWRLLYGLNPMVGVVEGFRWALLGQATAPGPMLAVSTLAVVALLFGGLYYFRRMEAYFADVV